MSDTTCTVTEACRRLQITERTVRRYIDKGDLAAAKVGNRIRVSITSIEEMLRPVGAASRAAARICTPEEVAETERFLEGLLAKARAERLALERARADGHD